MKDPYIRKCKLIRVVDGDTVILRIDLGYKCFTEHSIRLLGVDTPELRSKDPDERMRAQDAKSFVKDWFRSHGQDLVIRSEKSDSFGRWLGDISCSSCKSNLGGRLLELGHAEPYEK